MQKVYERINWENDPSTNTPINEDNLNKMDYAIDIMDSRVVSLYGYQDRVAQSELNAKTSETNAKTSELNAKQSEELAKQYMETAFAGTPEGYAALVEQVGRIDIAKTTDSTLYGSKKGGYRLQKLLGNTEQKTLSGKNLLSVNDFSLDVVGYLLSYTPISLKSGITYALSLVASATVGGCDFHLCREDKTVIQIVHVSFANFNTRNEIAFTPTEDVSYIRAYQSAGNTYTDVMISVEGGEYEPYCGGVPSPNPYYPQVIENVADCVEMVQGSYAYATGVYATGPNSVCNKHSVPCKSGDRIKISNENATSIACIFYKDNGYLTYQAYSTNEQEFIVPSGATKFNFDIQNTSGITPDTVGKITLTINGKYVGCVKGHGKNFFDMSQLLEANGWAENNGVYSGFVSVYGTAHNTGFRTPKFKNNTSYTISVYGYVSESGVTPRIRVFFTDGTNENLTINGTTMSKYTLTTPSNKTIDYICSAYGSAGTATLYIKDFQIEEGSVMTDYEPYQETIAYFLTNEPIRLGDMVFKDSDGLFKVERNLIEIECTNDGTWRSLNSSAGLSIYVTNANSLIKPSNENAYVKSSHFTDYIPAYGYKDGICVNNAKQITVRHAEAFPTLEDFTTWLADNPFKVLCTLATPTIEVLDTESQRNLNALETFDTVTYIEVDSRVQPLGISGEYGTSQVGAYTLLALNENDIDKVERAEMKAKLETLAVALVATGSEVQNV